MVSAQKLCLCTTLFFVHFLAKIVVSTCVQVVVVQRRRNKYAGAKKRGARAKFCFANLKPGPHRQSGHF